MWTTDTARIANVCFDGRRVVHLTLNSTTPEAVAHLLLEGMTHQTEIAFPSAQTHLPVRVRAVSIERQERGPVVVTTLIPAGTGGWDTRRWRWLLADTEPEIVISVEATRSLTRSVQLRDLTDRQREVLLLVVAGWRYKEIARKLGISVQTVKNHMLQVYRRIGVSTAPEAAAWVTRQQFAAVRA